MVVVPASVYKEMAKKLAPFLTDDQIILLNPGRTFGSVEVSKYIKQQRKNLKVYIAETQTLLFTSRSLEKDMVRIHKIKDSVKFSSFRVNENPYIHKKLKAFFPQLIPAKNYFQLTLNNIGMLLHPSVALLNSGAIETGLNFKFYGEGASKSICKILEKLQTEINQILKKIGLRRFDFCSWAKIVYGESGKNIYDTLQKISVYKGIDAPSELKTRYFTEDVPTGLVPLASLGRFLKIDTPTIDSIIHLSNLICDIDFWEEGRTIEALSLSRILKNRFNLETQIPEAVGERQEFLFI
jgi:opine dehydrogenase